MESRLQPSWIPDDETVANSNLRWLMERLGIGSYPDLHAWSVDHRSEYWEACLERLDIRFSVPPAAMVRGDAQHAEWLPEAVMNIAVSALDGPPGSTAIVHGTAGDLQRVSLAQLRSDVARCANGLATLDLGVGDAVGIIMPMTYEAVVGYLAIVAMGGVVVSIADSFAAEEIALRMELGGASWAITQHATERAGKVLPMYEKVVAAGVANTIVVPGALGPPLRDGDRWWDEVLADDTTLRFRPAPADATTNILFSSGTTGEPKAIPWSHTSPIKAAADGHFHQDIHPGDVVAWPTNLGWMMGPWLIYAALINDATVALCDAVPTSRGFVDFVAEAEVTMLGVVPSLVAAWRAGGMLADVDWAGVRVFSSTGEASNPDDMAWMMEAAGGRPVIEYCGGTEIAGGYVTGTVLHPAIAGTFTTPALGLDLVLVSEEGEEADEGEVLLVPPSIGLSTRLLNRDHDSVYYDSALPDLGRPLRRHGDHMERLANGYLRALGRVDDTMNLGGIKVSSAEIERTVGVVSGVSEVAAIGVPPPGGGPDRLVIYAVPELGTELAPAELRAAMQAEVRAHLNPLFKVHDVVLTGALPRTASAKVMRRSLRTDYAGGAS